jgi:AhpD family alkylhydroperoxidase
MSDRLIPAISPVPALRKRRSVATRRKRRTTNAEGRRHAGKKQEPGFDRFGSARGVSEARSLGDDRRGPESTLALLHLRASQINGCSVCVDMHSRELEDAGESSERMHTIAACCETPCFSDAGRAALALTEAATRLADRSDPVSDEVWNEAARHSSEPQLAALVVAIATINAFNRVNATARQISGPWIAQAVRMDAEAA